MMKSNSLVIICWGSFVAAPLSIVAAANTVNNHVEGLAKKSNAAVVERIAQRTTLPVHQNSIRVEGDVYTDYSSDDCNGIFSEEDYWFLVFAGCFLATQKKP